MSFQRAIRFARRLWLSAAGRIYLRAHALPRLRARQAVGDALAVHYGNGCAVIAEPHRLLKVRLDRRSTIGLEDANRAAAVAKWPALAAVLAECRLEEGAAPSYLAMPRYQPLGPDESVACAARVWRVMQGCRSGERKLALADSPQMRAGFAVLAGLYGEQTAARVRGRVEAFLGAGDYHLGFAHGDFHSRNLMLDKQGAPRLLDLDCIRLNGVQELDALYFVLEWEWSKSGALWQDTITGFLRGAPAPEQRAMLEGRFGTPATPGLATTYLVDRIGQEEATFGILSRRAVLDRAIGALA